MPSSVRYATALNDGGDCYAMEESAVYWICVPRRGPWYDVGDGAVVSWSCPYISGHTVMLNLAARRLNMRGDSIFNA